MNLDEAVRVYTVCARAENRSERTVEWVAGSTKRLAAFIGSDAIDVRTITVDTVRRFILNLGERRAFADHRFNKPLSKPVTPETVSSYVRGLKSLFSSLFQEGYIQKNPLARIRTPKVPVREPVILAEEEIARLFGAIDKKTSGGFRDYSVFLTLLDTGMRVSELCQLKLDDTDLENGYFRIMGKGKKERYVPIGYKLTKILLKYLSTYRYKDTGSNYLFVTKDGNPLNRNRVAKIIKAYARRAGITGKRVHPHALRATKAVLFLRNGGDLFTLQKCLGHSTLTMTRRYAAIADTDVRAAHLKYGVVDKLNI